MLHSRGTLVLVAAAAIAAGAIASASAITVSPTTIAAGGATVSISGDLSPGGGQVRVTVTGPGGFNQVLVDGNDPNCAYSTSVTIPAGAAAGTYTVEATGFVPPFGCEGEETAAFEVTAPASPPANPTVTPTPADPAQPAPSGSAGGSAGKVEASQGGGGSAAEPISAAPSFAG